MPSDLYLGTGGYRQAGVAIAARVYNSGNLSIAHNTVTALTFDSERFDTDGLHSTASNTSRLTAPVAGIYFVSGNIRWAANGTGRRDLYIVVNGTTTVAADSRPPVSGADPIDQSISTLVNLAAGDYVELQVYQSSGGALNVEVAGAFSPDFMMSRKAS